MPNIQKLKKERNINGLIKALNHKIWQIRCDAADALGDMNDSRAVEPLIAALEDERDSVPLNNCWVKMSRWRDPTESGGRERQRRDWYRLRHR